VGPWTLQGTSSKLRDAYTISCPSLELAHFKLISRQLKQIMEQLVPVLHNAM